MKYGTDNKNICTCIGLPLRTLGLRPGGKGDIVYQGSALFSPSDGKPSHPMGRIVGTAIFSVSLYIFIMNVYSQHIANRIKSAINNKNPQAEVILFGSRARGEENEDSDWDVLILLNTADVDRETEKEYREELFEVQLETGQAISTFVFSKQDWESKHSETPLYQNIQREGIHL